MVGFRRANGSKPVDTEWHAFREMARHNAHSAEEFSEVENTRYNLEDNPSYGESYGSVYGVGGGLPGARITGRETDHKFNPRDRALPSLQDEPHTKSPRYE